MTFLIFGVSGTVVYTNFLCLLTLIKNIKIKSLGSAESYLK